MMTTTRLRLLAAVGVAIGLLGGTATGIYLAAAADPAKSNENPVAKSEDPSPTVNKPAADVANAEPAGDSDPLQKPLKGIREAITRNAKNKGLPLEDLFKLIEDETDMIIRVDVAAFRRLEIDTGDEDGFSAQKFLNLVYNTLAVLPRRADKMPLRDVLGDALAQVKIGNLSMQCTYQIRGSQLVIVPAFVPPVKPGVDALNPIPERPQPGMDVEDLTILPIKQLWSQIYGGAVNVSANKKPLSDILADLRKQTGANIVLDPRCDLLDKKKTPLTVSLNDARLYDALRVIADMAELKMVYAGNVYYVTTPENAKTFFPSAPPPRMPMMPQQGIPGFQPANPVQP